MPDIPQTVPAPLKVESPATWTVTGRQVRFDAPTVESIVPHDIAYQLNRAARWVGATTRPWSVLDHTLYCDEIGCEFYHASDQLRRYVLLHDAHEAYTGDIPMGLKKLIPEIKGVQARLDAAIRTLFGLGKMSDGTLWFVHRIDKMALQGEAKAFLAPGIYEAMIPLYGEAPRTLPQIRGRGVAIAEFKARCYEVGLRIAGEDE